MEGGEVSAPEQKIVEQGSTDHPDVSSKTSEDNSAQPEIESTEQSEIPKAISSHKDKPVKETIESPDQATDTEEGSPGQKTQEDTASKTETTSVIAPEHSTGIHQTNIVHRLKTRTKKALGALHTSFVHGGVDPERKKGKNEKDISRRTALKYGGAALGAAGIASVESRFRNNTAKAAPSEPIDMENILDEYIGNASTISPSPKEDTEALKQLMKEAKDWSRESLNSKGLLLPDQFDESSLYPDYYLNGGNPNKGTSIPTRQSDGTLSWSRDYRPINTDGLLFNPPPHRIPKELRDVMPFNTRSAENWWKIVNQYGLDNPDNLRYQPDQYTYCNFAARDMLRAFGIGDIPQWFKDFETGNIRETVTNIMYEQIKKYGTFNKELYDKYGADAREWISVDKKTALKFAQSGTPITMLTGRTNGVGHIALMAPTSTEDRLIVAQAGAKTGIVEWDESHYSSENNYKETMYLVHISEIE